MKEILIIAGPNGAGKTTFAQGYLSTQTIEIEFLNADNIANTIAPGVEFEKVRVAAGKIYLNRLKTLIDQESSFLIESTLSGSYLLSKIQAAKARGYRTEIVYIFLENKEIAIQRVKKRVLKGGHPVPEEDVIRRFNRSKNNFWGSYKNYVDNWFLFDNSNKFKIVAYGNKNDYSIERMNVKKLDMFLNGIKINKRGQ